MLMRDYPGVVNLARRAQQRLAGSGGLHMTPLQWLHMTTLVAGPAADFSPQQLQEMSETAADLLASTPPATVTLGQVLYHPEAIMLGVSPAEALTPITARRGPQPSRSQQARVRLPSLRAGRPTSLSAKARPASPPSPSSIRSASSCPAATST